ncbi:hypothetical protein [Micromonospora sp. NPDC049102]|uniref:hypothetical protein n=1 Tax=Micromonospora sp. NPDC049102 TaxID=3364265 RepID=UPI0037217F93
MPLLPTEEDPRLTLALTENRVCTGVTTLRGRAFVSYPSADGPGVQVAEALPDGGRNPYPDAAWNRPDQSPDGAFVHVNGLRAGPDGRLWIVDSGAPQLGARQIPGGARLIVVDVDRDRVDRMHHLDAAVRPDSYIDDVRFHDGTAYLTDAGADQLEVSPDGRPAGLRRHVPDRHPLAGRPDPVARGVGPTGRALVGQAEHRLSWVDAMWLDTDGQLWMPAAQLHLTAGLNGGHSAVDYPVEVYRMPVDAVPPPLGTA